MADVLSNHWVVIDNTDVKSDGIIDSQSEINIKSQAKEYILQRVSEWISSKDLQELVENAKKLLQKQNIEKINLKETLKTWIITETKEDLNIEKLIQETKTTLYEKLWIKFELWENTDIKKFVKWFVDGLVINNIETVKQIIEMWIEKFVESLKELLSVSGILEFLKSIKDEVSNLTDIIQKPYEGWVIIWWYGLWIFGKWLKWLSFLKKAEKVESKVSNTPELWALNDAVPWKVPYKKVLETSKYEIDMISDSSRNLQAILKDFDPKDRFIVESLNKKANLWIEARLWNINNMLNYAIAHPWDLKEFKDMVKKGFLDITGQINNFWNKWLVLWKDNRNKMIDVRNIIKTL